MNKRLLSLLLIFMLIFSLISCDNDEKEEMNITYTESVIMKGTSYETEVYVINSGIEGPKVAILGGAHGDETAGWTAATRFKEKLINGEYYFKGQILIIPKANKYACIKGMRKPKIENDTCLDTSNTEYYNLNRCYPGKTDGSITEKLAYEIVNTIETFGASVFLDLHESQKSHTLSKGGDNYEWLGETLICGNNKSSGALSTILKEYNDKHPNKEFDYKLGPEKGTFTDYFSGQYYIRNYVSDNNIDSTDPYISKIHGYTKLLAYTVETTRTLDLEVRVTEQLDIVDCILNYVYSEN